MIKELDDLTRPIIGIYNQLELDLIEAIAKRFDAYDKIGGSLEWQIKKLDEMGALNADAARAIASYSKKTEKEIRAMMQEAALGNVDLAEMQNAYNAGFLFVDPSKITQSPGLRSTLEDSYKELNTVFKLINTKAQESVKSSYMSVINKSYIEVSSGLYDYNSAIKRAVSDMANDGITAATYRRGGKVVKYSIEAAVRRDTLTAVHQTANRNSFALANELGVGYVEVSSHVGARTHPTNHIANHAWWQGKVYKIDGFDQYDNLRDCTGYPDDILGLGGVNCRHRMFPFVPGISEPMARHYDENEAARVYKLTQIQRSKERKIRAVKKKIVAMRAIGENTEKLLKKLDSLYADIKQFCKENNLTREWSREMAQGER